MNVSIKDVYTNFIAALLILAPNCNNTDVHQKMSRSTMCGVQPYNRILFNNKKEQTTDRSNNVDESQKHLCYAKKIKTKEYILYDSIYIKV